MNGLDILAKSLLKKLPEKYHSLDSITGHIDISGDLKRATTNFSVTKGGQKFSDVEKIDIDSVSFKMLLRFKKATTPHKSFDFLVFDFNYQKNDFKLNFYYTKITGEKAIMIL